MNNNEYLVGVYKEVGKTPDIIKIKNQKEYLEKLVDGEYTNLDYDDYTIIYKKNNSNLLSNIYVNQYSKLGTSLKGKVFAVGKNDNGTFKSLTKEQARKCISFFLKESFNYKNFDEQGKYIPRSQRKNNKKIFGNKNKQSNEQPKQEEPKQEKVIEEKKSTTISTNDMVQALNIGNSFFESQFRLEKVESNKKDDTPSISNENQKQSENQQNSTSITPPVIKLSDEQTLNMILKVVFTILDFVKNALEDSNEDE